MGRKVHPVGFRLGFIRDWQAKWYAGKEYGGNLQEDLLIRGRLMRDYSDAGISLTEIERQANKVTIAVHTSRPGVVIGRGGQRVDEMKHRLESLTGKAIQLNILEVQQPELDAYLVARSVADQLERRVAHRRAMKQALARTIQSGAQGIKIRCSGRLGGAEIARSQEMHQGRIPLHTLRADIDYGFAEASTAMGRIGVKVWIYKGDVLPEQENIIEDSGLDFINTEAGAGEVGAIETKITEDVDKKNISGLKGEKGPEVVEGVESGLLPQEALKEPGTLQQATMTEPAEKSSRRRAPRTSLKDKEGLDATAESS